MRGLLACSLALLALPAAARADPPTADVQLDLSTAKAIRDRDIIATVTAPATSMLSISGPSLAFPVDGSELGGGMVFSRGSTRVAMTHLTLSGNRIRARCAGHTYDLVVLEGVERTADAVRFTSGVFAGTGARALRTRFRDPVFKGGTRYFLSGSIPR